MLTSVFGGRSEANMADSAPLSMVSGPLWLLKVCHYSFDFEKCVLIEKSVASFKIGKPGHIGVNIAWVDVVHHNVLPGIRVHLTLVDPDRGCSKDHQAQCTAMLTIWWS